MLDFNKIRTISIKDRKHKVRISDLIKPEDNNIKPLDTPRFNELAERVLKAAKNGKQIIFMLGGHVVKTGMSLLVIDLMKKGIIKHIAMNGSVPIHDFELAYFGETSEYVENTIKDGTFGMVEETGRILNQAIIEGSKEDHGMGFSIGKKIAQLDLKNKEASILYNAYKLGIPATVHVAIGTDTIHQHPSCDGSATGKTTYKDFRLFCDSISKLEEGAVINIGCCVVLPEVFLKALTVARNLCHNIRNITTANLDMLDHYRPRQNVVLRPTSLGGKGFIIQEKHQVTVPSLHKKLTEGIK